MPELSNNDFADLTADLLERMDVQLAKWEENEPRDDWWTYQRDYAQARDTILAMQGD